jgi:hypothetical protein
LYLLLLLTSLSCYIFHFPFMHSSYPHSRA